MDTQKLFNDTCYKMAESKVIDIVPVAKPRMTQRDRWMKRNVVVRYYHFANHIRLLNPKIEWEGVSLQFVLPMPKSWSKKKRAEMNGRPHKQTPDLSNMIKAIEDSLLKDDSRVWHYGLMMKTWGEKGCIIINPTIIPIPSP